MLLNNQEYLLKMTYLQITWEIICCLMNVHKETLPGCPGITEHWGSRWGGREEGGSSVGRKCGCLLLHASAVTYSLLSSPVSLLPFILQWATQCWVKGNRTWYFLQSKEVLLEEECCHETVFSGHRRNVLIELLMVVVKSFPIFFMWSPSLPVTTTASAFPAEQRSAKH